jgi:hypothetical protein
MACQNRHKSGHKMSRANLVCKPLILKAGWHVVSYIWKRGLAFGWFPGWSRCGAFPGVLLGFRSPLPWVVFQTPCPDPKTRARRKNRAAPRRRRFGEERQWILLGPQ